MAFFRYSEPKYSRRMAWVGAAGLQLLGVCVTASAFWFLNNFFGKPAVALGHSMTSFAGVVVGFHLVAFSYPLPDNRIRIVAYCLLSFAAFYWFASFSLPDLWLAQSFAGLGSGIFMAALFRLWFLKPPILPRVP